MHETALLWFRRDLRLADNPSLVALLQRARTIVPVAVEPPAYAPGAAATAWRAASLEALDAALRERGSALVVLNAPPESALTALAREVGATLVACTRAWDPASLAEEASVASALADAGIGLDVAESAYLVPPGRLASGSGTAYRVFTPFLRAWENAVEPRQPLDAPERIASPSPFPVGDGLPKVSPAIADMWTPGEVGAARRLAHFIRGPLDDYAELRDRPDIEGTSALSPHLAAGELSPGQVMDALRRGRDGTDSSHAFIRQLAWREFAAHVLYEAPDLATLPLRPEFASMPWRDDPPAEDRWRAGMTGYPLIDAGMRQLAQTGWMHNRVRLVAASFLTKDLLVGWQAGERFFRDALVDYDPAQNAFNWQWVAGSGADAAPYFRIFNPVLQATRFDPDGAYIREWVPELGALSPKWIGHPWEAPEDLLTEADITLGATYPAPVVDHSVARKRALAAYGSLSS